jgi:hypothetical protein
MTGINHLATGALIGLSVSQPIVALPLAFVSHFLLDAMPHFGFPDWSDRRKHMKLFLTVTIIDMMLIALFVAFLLVYNAPALSYVTALAAFSPDFVWIYRFTILERMGSRQPRPNKGLTKFHSDIQKAESTHGIFTEVVWFLLIGYALVKVLE